MLHTQMPSFDMFIKANRINGRGNHQSSFLSVKYHQFQVIHMGRSMLETEGAVPHLLIFFY